MPRPSRSCRATPMLDVVTVASGWEAFYTIVGSSAGALIGLQFVVISLIATRPVKPGVTDAGSAFATPSVVHFSAVLFLSALLTVPSDETSLVAALWGLMGLAGIGYVLVVARRMRRQTHYKPVWEDWLFHVLLPLAAYAVLAVSAVLALFAASPSLFLIAAAALVLLFTGVHNAWDAVMYVVLVRPRQEG